MVGKAAGQKFLLDYQKAYSSITGLKVTNCYDFLRSSNKDLNDPEIVEHIKSTLNISETEFRQKFVSPFLHMEELERLGNEIILHNELPNGIFSDIAIGALPTSNFNATAISHNNNPIIVLNSGLMAFTHEIANCYIGSVVAPLWSVSEAMARIIEWSAAIATGYGKFGLTTTSSLNDIELQMISGSISGNVKVFTIAHEFGHILAGHLSDSKLCRENLFNGFDASVKVYTKEEAEEFEADDIGFKLSLRWCKATHGNEQPAFFSIIFCFHLLSLMELFSENITSGHPSANARRKQFESRYKCKFSYETTKEIENMDVFMTIVQNRIIKLNNEYRK